MLGTIVAINCMLNMLFPISNPSSAIPGATIISYQKEKITVMSPGGVVFVGDSSLGNSLDAKLLGSIIDVDCYNLSLVASYTLMADYYLIKYLAKRVKPRAIVISHAFSLIEKSDTYGRNEKVLARVFDEHENPFQDFILHNVYMVRNQAIAKAILFKERFGLNSNFLSAYQTASHSTVSLGMYGENDYPPQGEPINLASNYVPPRKEHYSYDFVDKWLSLCAELCKEHDIELYFMYNPLLKEFDSANFDYYEHITSHIVKITPKMGIVFLDLNNPTFPSEYLGDTFYHLHPSMKQHYTRWLGKILAQSPLCGFSVNDFNEAVRNNPLQWP